jgi:hypothetical protein
MGRPSFSPRSQPGCVVDHHWRGSEGMIEAVLFLLAFWLLFRPSGVGGGA